MTGGAAGSAGVVLGEQAIREELARVTPDARQTLKEVARHGLLTFGAMGLLDAMRRARGFKADSLISDSPAETFARTYAEGGWVHSEGQVSRSGVGSELHVTRGLFGRIHATMQALDARSMVDVGCGDWNWMKEEAFDFDYVGIDIVESVIADNQARHARANVRFQTLDAISEPVPVADFALCREILFHLSFAHARRVIAHVARSCRFLCATCDVDIGFNSDIRTGDFRLINLTRAPFDFPAPVALIPDSQLKAGRYLAVWRVADLPQGWTG